MALDASPWLQPLAGPVSADAALTCLAPAVQSWFRASYGTPTHAQRLAWPAITQGQHLLLSSPTGTGKTLAAFLPIVSDILNDESFGGLRCLYLAPLKALGRDARNNLRQHCREIHLSFAPDLPRVRVGLRTGDTSPRVKQRHWTDPPHVLMTTPESLAVLLTHPRAADLFRTLRWVVVDEVHALSCSKRGADLAVSLERLESLTESPLQRIGLSATCTPLSVAAKFLVGAGRVCQLAQVPDRTDMQLLVEALLPEPSDGVTPRFLTRLLERLDEELQQQRTTLIFTNTRSLAERVTWALRRRHPQRADEIGVHHSSLSAARRRLVERQLKNGDLWVAVSSASLELGIDIGSVDSVVFVHPPGGVVRLLQRLGRSGHRPDQPRRGLVLTASVSELLEATVTAASGRDSQLEPLQPSKAPFDVLCQQLVGMAMTGAWTIDEAESLLRRTLPFEAITRAELEDCVDYLSGRRRDGTAWLPSRLRWEGDRFMILDDRTAKLLRRNLGTILSEDPCRIQLRKPVENPGDDLPDTVLVGEIDEIFANQLQPGDRFVLDGRCLEMRRRDGSEVLVEEVLGRPLVPRWTGSGVPMPSDLAQRLYLFRVQAAELLREGSDALNAWLRADYGLHDEAADILTRYFTMQETVSEIPDLGTLLVECVSLQGCVEHYLHTPLPRPANDTLAKLLTWRMQAKHGLRAAAMALDLGILIVGEEMLPMAPDAWRGLLRDDGFEDDWHRCLEQGDTVRQAFGRVAQTGLMVLRSPQGRKRQVGGRDWAERRLFDVVRSQCPDFVLLRQAEREVWEAASDAATARAFLRRVPSLQIRVRHLPQPSPFAEGFWQNPIALADAYLAPDEALSQLHREMTERAPP